MLGHLLYACGISHEIQPLNEAGTINHPHFTDMETRMQRAWVTCPRSPRGPNDTATHGCVRSLCTYYSHTCSPKSSLPCPAHDTRVTLLANWHFSIVSKGHLKGHWNKGLCSRVPPYSSQQLLWHVGHPRCSCQWVLVSSPRGLLSPVPRRQLPSPRFSAVHRAKATLLQGLDHSTGQKGWRTDVFASWVLCLSLRGRGASCTCRSWILRVLLLGR